MDSLPGPLVPPMPRRETPAAAAADLPTGYGDGHALPLASPLAGPADLALTDEATASEVEALPVPGVAPVEGPAVDEPAVETEALADLSDLDDLDEVPPAPADTLSVAVAVPAFTPAEPLPAGAPDGKDLVLVSGGQVVAAPESVYVVDLDALVGPAATVDDLFAALKALAEVNPSETRDHLVDRLTVEMRGRMGL